MSVVGIGISPLGAVVVALSEEEAVPTIETTSTGTSGSTNQTSHAITLPSGIEVGDLIVVGVAFDSLPTIGIDTGASGENWTLVTEAPEGASPSAAIVWKVAEGSDALTMTTSAGETNSHIAYRISGASSIEIDGASATFSSGAPNPPSLSPSESAPLWLAFGFNDNEITATSAPTDFTGLLTSVGSGVASASAMSAHRVFTAASLDPGTFDNGSSNEEWAAFTVAVIP